MKPFITLAALRRNVKRVYGTHLRGISPGATQQLHSKKCSSGGKSLATLRQVWPARDLYLRPPAPENALPLV